MAELIVRDGVTYEIYTDHAYDPALIAAGVPQLKYISAVCTGCGSRQLYGPSSRLDEDGNPRRPTRDDALREPMATCPNKGHASWRLAWHIPEPVT